MAGKLYLLPTTLGDTPWELVLPATIHTAIMDCKHFIVENERTARRFLKKVEKSIVIDDLQFYVLNKRTTKEELSTFLKPLGKDRNIGLMSEAGCPGIADPGADIVAMAQQREYKVVPIVGPSSIFLSLMASGLNGQNFGFNGYLPIPKPDRIAALKELERRTSRGRSTQIFIETPYRNNHLFDDIIATCAANTKVCVAVDITLETEMIQTKTVAQWKHNKPNLHKRPAIFLISQ